MIEGKDGKRYYGPGDPWTPERKLALLRYSGYKSYWDCYCKTNPRRVVNGELVPIPFEEEFPDEPLPPELIALRNPQGVMPLVFTEVDPTE